MLINEYQDWLSNELKQELVDLFQPSYDHTLTENEVINIAQTLANLAELSIKFNWRASNDQ